VEFVQSGVTSVVDTGRSIVEVAEEHGIPVITSCEEGVCGTCETKVYEGLPDHRDSVLSDEEKTSGNTMMICVSRCLSATLRLDL
jgi:ferredoxin